MSVLRLLRKMVAPDHTIRATIYSVLRESIRRPRALFDRIHSTNFRNHAALARLRIECNVCGVRSGIYYDFPGVNQRAEHGIGLLRETTTCRTCSATMRHRTLAYGLLNSISKLTGQQYASVTAYRDSAHVVDILDTDCYSPLHKILSGKAGYISSKYLPDVDFGKELAPSIYNLDLQAISFDSDRFDVIMTSDVMEHVENDCQAHREIFRVLRTGGAYVFTVPCDLNLSYNRILALRAQTEILYTGTPHFHGDPITGGILAYRIYGRELMTFLRDLGMSVDFYNVERPENGIYMGDCFIASKLSATVGSASPSH